MSTTDHYDAIIVGGRAAGAATAMLLARQGRRVLVLERAAFGSDTTSTHALMKGGVLQLHRWGLLDEVRAAGTPALGHTVVHYDDVDIDIPVEDDGAVDALYAPRRTVLDPILARAAEAAGAEVRFDTPVTEVTRDRSGRVIGVTYRTADGRRADARAPLTIGADGVRSLVARTVGAPTTRAGSSASAVIYTYVDGADIDGFHWFFRDGGGSGLIPTNDGVLAYIGVASSRFETELRPDVAAGFWRMLRRYAPEADEAIAGSERISRFHVHPGTFGFQRRPQGPGWALVGDASHFKDPLSAHGLTDALRDAELLARAVGSTLDAPDEVAIALEAYEADRDRLSTVMFDLTDRVAACDWSAEEARRLLKGMSRCMAEEVEVLRGLEPTEPATVVRAAVA